MRKAMWTVAGLVGLSLLLCGAGDLLAQADTATSPAGTVDGAAADTRVQGTEPGDARVGTPVSPSPGTQATGTAGGTGTVPPDARQATGGADATTVELRQTVLQLQAEVAQMRQELTQLRAALASVNATLGVGGSGQAGAAQPVAPPASTAPQSTATTDTTAQGTGGSGNAVVNAIYTGTVRSVSDRRLEFLNEDGQPFTLELDARTRVSRDGQQISARQLEQGTRVRVTVDMLSPRDQVVEIVALPTR